MRLHRDVVDAAILEQTLGCIFKYRDDMEIFRKNLTDRHLDELGIAN